MQLIRCGNGTTDFSVSADEMRIIHNALDRTEEFDSAMLDGVSPARIVEIRRALSPDTVMNHALLADLAKVLYQAARDDDSERMQTMIAEFDTVAATVLSSADKARFERHFG